MVKYKLRLVHYWRILWYTFLLYLTIVHVIQRFKSPKLTETQLLQEIPNNLVLKFKL
jgi:hypothetical protein